jgi:hypothetical protein
MKAALGYCGMLLLASMFACNGGGPAEGEPVERRIIPAPGLGGDDLRVPSDLAVDYQYWVDQNWRAGVIPVNIAGEPLGRRKALMYYSLIVAPFYRQSTLVVQTVPAEEGEKDKVMQALCKDIGFAISDSTYSPHRQAQTYYIWITDFIYSSKELAWLSNYILDNYPDDFVAVVPIVSDRPQGGGVHNDGWGSTI